MSLSLSDVLVIEGEEEASEEEYFASVQNAINAGSWSMQGSFGRTMMSAIENGACLLGKSGCRDYYGNYIPSRDEVQSGTKGSYEFVVARMGKEHADIMKKV